MSQDISLHQRFINCFNQLIREKVAAYEYDKNPPSNDYHRDATNSTDLFEMFRNISEVNSINIGDRPKIKNFLENSIGSVENMHIDNTNNPVNARYFLNMTNLDSFHNNTTKLFLNQLIEATSNNYYKINEYMYEELRRLIEANRDIFYDGNMWIIRAHIKRLFNYVYRIWKIDFDEYLVNTDLIKKLNIHYDQNQNMEWSYHYANLWKYIGSPINIDNLKIVVKTLEELMERYKHVEYPINTDKFNNITYL